MSSCKFLVKIMVVYTILVIMACTSYPTTSPTPAIESELTLTQKLKNTLDDSLNNSSVQGVSSAIIMPNEQIWLGVSGMSDPTIEEQITPEMLFDIGSTGKNYLAALMGTWRFHTWISVNRNVPARLRNDDIGNDQW